MTHMPRMARQNFGSSTADLEVGIRASFSLAIVLGRNAEYSEARSTNPSFYSGMDTASDFHLMTFRPFRHGHQEHIGIYPKLRLHAGTPQLVHLQASNRHVSSDAL